MSTILALVIGFIIQVVALKFSLSLLGQASAQNKLGTAVGVVALLNVAMFLTAMIPFADWILKPLIWLMVIMAVYRIGFLKSIGLAIIQTVLQLVLKWILVLIGLSWLAGA